MSGPEDYVKYSAVWLYVITELFIRRIIMITRLHTTLIDNILSFIQCLRSVYLCSQ